MNKWMKNLRNKLMDNLIPILLLYFILIASISFLWVVGCQSTPYVPDVFFYYACPCAILCAGALIALAIFGKFAADKWKNKETKSVEPKG